MLFERFEVPGLAHYSYAVGCPAARRIAVVDPRRDVDVYLDFARERDVEITHVLETHIHADYASGARELAARAGAELLVSAYDDGETYAVGFDHRDMEDGGALELGSVTLEARHTPGHTPEHLSFLVYDRSRSPEIPMAMLSGDFLFVGSLGRPDLLGEEATEGLARRLYRSVQSLAGLPDGIEIHPAHGAGSMCGSGMGGRPTSTLGYERVANPYLRYMDEDDFVDRILGSVPPFPPYYRRMKRLNSEGPALLHGLPGDEAVEPERFRELVSAGHVVVDVRDRLGFGAGHVPGSIGIEAGDSLSVWAAWVVPYDRPILLVAPDVATVEPAVRSFLRVGHDQVVGYLAGGIGAWVQRGEPLAEIPQLGPREIHASLGNGNGTRVLDVRTEEEWSSGHIEGAVNVMAGFLQEHLDELPRNGVTLVVTCDSGFRSNVAASLLRRNGFERVVNLAGGMRAWKAAGLPTTTGT